jgi:hypothetical protein
MDLLLAVETWSIQQVPSAGGWYIVWLGQSCGMQQAGMLESDGLQVVAATLIYAVIAECHQMPLLLYSCRLSRLACLR